MDKVVVVVVVVEKDKEDKEEREQGIADIDSRHSHFSCYSYIICQSMISKGAGFYSLQKTEFVTRKTSNFAKRKTPGSRSSGLWRGGGEHRMSTNLPLQCQKIYFCEFDPVNKECIVFRANWALCRKSKFFI